MGLRDHIRKPPTAKIGTAGRSSEKRVAKAIGARLRPASGAMVGAKGDMTVSSFLVESKSTVKGAISIQYDWLGKITTEALPLGKTPALTISFTDEKGKALNFGDWCLVPMHIFQQLIEDSDV